MRWRRHSSLGGGRAGGQRVGRRIGAPEEHPGPAARERATRERLAVSFQQRGATSRLLEPRRDCTRAPRRDPAGAGAAKRRSDSRLACAPAERDGSQHAHNDLRAGREVRGVKVVADGRASPRLEGVIARASLTSQAHSGHATSMTAACCC
jgi:hypothetical protein